MAVGDAWLFNTSANTTFFPKPPTTFITCFSRDERRKYTGKKVCIDRVSNSQTPSNESDTLTTEQPGRATAMAESNAVTNRRVKNFERQKRKREI